jgi:hypothetical protein
MDGLMSAVRILLILMVAVVFDLGGPVLPGAESYEEAAHGHRRLQHLVQLAAPATTPVRVAVAVVAPTWSRLRRPPVRASLSPARKPPPLSDPASASEDH